jgi:hypothetical protein
MLQLTCGIGLILVSTIAAIAIVIAYRRAFAHPIAFALGAIALMVLLPLTLNSGTQAATQAAVLEPAVNTVVVLLAWNLMWALGPIAFCWGWYRRGGWGLLAFAPLAFVWIPLLASVFTSPSQVLDVFLGLRPDASWLQALTCISFWALLAGVLTVVADLLRAANAEMRVH